MKNYFQTMEIDDQHSTDSCRQFTDGRSVDPFLVFDVIHQVTPDDTKYPPKEANGN